MADRSTLRIAVLPVGGGLPNVVRADTAEVRRLLEEPAGERTPLSHGARRRFGLKSGGVVATEQPASAFRGGGEENLMATVLVRDSADQPALRGTAALIALDASGAPTDLPRGVNVLTLARHLAALAKSTGIGRRG